MMGGLTSWRAKPRRRREPQESVKRLSGPRGELRLEQYQQSRSRVPQSDRARSKDEREVVGKLAKPGALRDCLRIKAKVISIPVTRNLAHG